MHLENSFAVAYPADRLWDTLLGDIEGVVTCIPGAGLTDVTGPGNYRGSFKVRFGPVALSFDGTVTVKALDETANRLVLDARGTEKRGRGAARVSVTLFASPDGNGDSTRVDMSSEVTLNGQVAQMSRGVLPKVAKDLTGRFAECLRAKLEAGLRPDPPEGSRRT